MSADHWHDDHWHWHESHDSHDTHSSWPTGGSAIIGCFSGLIQWIVASILPFGK